MTDTAALFDIDGTLVDSNYLHVAAWYDAFLASGETVPQASIHGAIGMGGPQLLERLLGKEKAERIGDEVTERHSDNYADARPRLLRALPGARALLRAVHDRGVKVALSTSAGEDELADLLRVLDSDDVLDVVIGSADVDTAKPAPDIVSVTLERVVVDAGDAVFVGDTGWDAKAAAKAGVSCVGLLTGGIGEAELLDAGMTAVYSDAADLLAQLDRSPLAALYRA